MLLDLNHVEDFFIELLAPLLDIPVEAFPDVQSIEDFRQEIISAKGAVTVSIPRVLKGVSHEAKDVFGFLLNFHIYLSSFRNRSGHVGVYDVIKAIVDNVDEKRFTISAHPCTTHVTDAYYVDRSDDLYHYTVEMEVRPKFYRVA